MGVTRSPWDWTAEALEENAPDEAAYDRTKFNFQVVTVVAAGLESLAGSADVAGGGALAGDTTGALKMGGGRPAQLQANYEAGRAFEESSGIIRNTDRIPSASGKAQYRTPDELNLEERTMNDFKFTNRQGLTPQVRDFIAHSEREGLTFSLTLKEGAYVTKPLQAQVDAGKLIIFFRLF